MNTNHLKATSASHRHSFRPRSYGRLAWCLAVLLPGVLPIQAQSSFPLQIETLRVVPGDPIEFTFRDAGSGATNYQVEFSERLEPSTAWEVVTSATITDLGGGQFQAEAPDPQRDQGYYRVRALGGTATVTASFNANLFQVTEGGMVAPVIIFSAPYIGMVRYSISGTVASGDYVGLTGEVMVNGISATLPVTFADNDMIGQLKYLILTLEAGGAYQLGSGSSTTIRLDENDAEWRGTFRTRGAALGFLLAIRQLNGIPTATLRSDTLGFFPTDATSVSLVFQEETFQMDASAIPLDAGATAFNTPVRLLFHLEASNAVPNQSVRPTQIEGDGYLVSQYPDRPHLSTTNVGTFTLFKPALAPSTNQVNLIDAL